MTSFKTAMLFVFGGFAVIGMLLFAFGGGGGLTGGGTSSVVIWGTADRAVIDELLKRMRAETKGVADISYIEKDPRTYEQEFVEALASGVGPDILLLSEDMIVAHRNKVATLPYENFSARLFKDTFVEEGELFTDANGIIGFPFTIDPLVLYWNRNIFASTGIAQPPALWEELFTMAPRLIERDRAGNIVRSMVAFGEYRNVDNAKAILSALILQAGNTIVARKEDGTIDVALGERGEFPIPPAEAALRFYTDFSNPVQKVYSWNRALPRSRQAFIAGDLALYIGFASELSELRRLNPNLNFDVAPLPQSKEAAFRRTYGTMTALSVTRASRSQTAAFQTAILFSGRVAGEVLASVTALPPVRRDLLARPQSDAYKTVFNESALFSRGWLDPDRAASDRIFNTMVEDVTSGRFRVQQAVSNAHKELADELR